MNNLDPIIDLVERGERISAAEALTLWNEAPLWLLARLAMAARKRRNGDLVYYNRNFHIEPSNICLFNCKFCSYRRSEGQAGGWDLTLEQVADIARSYRDNGEASGERGDSRCGERNRERLRSRGRQAVASRPFSATCRSEGRNAEGGLACTSSYPERQCEGPEAGGSRNAGVTEVHIVGSVHPAHGLDYWLEMIRTVHSILPGVAIKAFSAVELAHMITEAGLDYPTGLRILREAGVEAIPGGGAEIFDPEVRRQICPEKIDADQWLALHEAAHGVGIISNATMLYGHIETPAQRIDHLERLRGLQDRTGGFNAFIPLKFRAAGNRLSHLCEVGIVEDMKVVALSRIFLDNFAHIKAYWPMYGKAAAELALSFGADDLDGTIDDTTRIYSMAGSEEGSPSMTVAEVERMAAAAGLRAVERDTHYNEII